MKQETFKEMYDDIQLDKEQKARIWSHLEKEENGGYKKRGNRWRGPVLAAACACLILIGGVSSVLAANSPALHSLLRAFDLLGGYERNLTEEQENIYEEHGTVLDQEVNLPHRTVKLETMITDEHFVCLSFSVDIGTKAGKAGKNIIDTPFFNDMLENLSLDWQCYLDEDESDLPMGKYVVLNPVIEEDGRTLCGTFLLYNTENSLRKGKTIRLCKEIEEDQIPTATLCSLTLSAPVEQKTIAGDKLPKQLTKKISVNKITLSSLSINIEGNMTSSMQALDFFNAEVQLADGSLISSAETGPSSRYRDDDDHDHAFSAMVVLQEPVNIEDVEGIYLPSYDPQEPKLWIPLND